jgi:succinate-acetate transporter protein
MANENQGKPSRIGKTFKLFLLTFVVLCVPLAMDQAEVDPDKVRLVGRVAAGITALLVVYGIFTKLLKIMGFVIVVLLAMVFLVSEGHMKAPRVKNWFATHSAR